MCFVISFWNSVTQRKTFQSILVSKICSLLVWAFKSLFVDSWKAADYRHINPFNAKYTCSNDHQVLSLWRVLLYSVTWSLRVNHSVHFEQESQSCGRQLIINCSVTDNDSGRHCHTRISDRTFCWVIGSVGFKWSMEHVVRGGMSFSIYVKDQQLHNVKTLTSFHLK